MQPELTRKYDDLRCVRRYQVADIILELWTDRLVTKPWKVSNYEQEALYVHARYTDSTISLNAALAWQFAAFRDSYLTRALRFYESRRESR